MKKIKTSIIAASLAFAPCAYAQDVITIPNLDMDEDTTEVTTVSDIVKMQQKVITNNNTEKHYLETYLSQHRHKHHKSQVGRRPVRLLKRLGRVFAARL